MASKSGAIRAGKAFVEAYLDDSALRRGLRLTERRLKAFGAGVQAIGRNIQATFRGVGDAVGSVGRRLTGLGLAAAVPLGAATKTFADFESQMARVKALLSGSIGGQELEDSFAKLSDKAKQLGRDTVFSAGQAAEAMSNFALAGFKTDQILKAVGPTLDLAAAGQIEIAEAADIAAKIMSGMGHSADELANDVDILAKAMTTANTDILMLGEAFKYVGPIAKTAGISMEEITAAIQLLSNAGIQGEMAGTTLRGMILSLASPSKEAQAVLDELGVKTKDAAGNFRPLVEIIGDLEKALAGTGSGERLAKLGTVFPDRQAAGAAELVAQGAQALADATKALGSSAGTASRIAATQLDTLAGSFKIVMSAIEGLAIEVGSALAPTLREVAKSVIDATGKLAEFIKRNKGLVLAVAAAAAGAVALGLALTALAPIITAVGIAVGAVVSVLGLAVTAVGTLVGVVSFLATPVGLVTAALVAGAAVLIDWGAAAGSAAGTAKDAFGSMKDTAVAAFGGIADALKAGDIEGALKILGAALKVEWIKLTDALGKIWNDFLGRLKDAATGAIGGFADALSVVTGVEIGAPTELGQGTITEADRAEAERRRQNPELMAAEAELKALIEAARAGVPPDAAPAGPDAGAAGGVFGSGFGDLLSGLKALTAAPEVDEQVADAAEQIDSGMEQARRTTEARGGFGASALRGAGIGQSTAERQLDEQKQTNRKLDDLNKKARTGRLVFT